MKVENDKGEVLFEIEENASDFMVTLDRKNNPEAYQRWRQFSVDDVRRISQVLARFAQSEGMPENLLHCARDLIDAVEGMETVVKQSLTDPSAHFYAPEMMAAGMRVGQTMNDLKRALPPRKPFAVMVATNPETGEVLRDASGKPVVEVQGSLWDDLEDRTRALAADDGGPRLSLVKPARSAVINGPIGVGSIVEVIEGGHRFVVAIVNEGLDPVIIGEDRSRYRWSMVRELVDCSDPVLVGKARMIRDGIKPSRAWLDSLDEKP